MKNLHLAAVIVLFLGISICWPNGRSIQANADLSNESGGLANGIRTDSGKVANEDEKFEPVDNMHHFMEYISKPSYMELRKILANEKISRGDWRKVKQHSLILAETSKLVSERGPDDKEQNADWKKIAFSSHKEGAELYKAAGKRDREVALKHYGAMMDACNLCHKKYDPKNHQLAK